jgi:Flp pilus assembly protein TadG
MTALSRARRCVRLACERLKSRRVELSDDRGVSAIELAIFGPILLIIIMLIIQWALWFEARQVALDAAQAGAQYAREYAGAQQSGWASQAAGQATTFYDKLGTSIIKGFHVGVNPPGGNPNQVSVTVTGTIPTLIPWFPPLTVHETSGGDVECFRSAAAGGRSCG